MTPLDCTIHRLYEQGLLLNKPNTPNKPKKKDTDKEAKDEKDDEPIDIRSYPYTYMGRLVEQRVIVDPVMKKSTLDRIVKNATEGSMQDMATVAMLYNVGYGLPKDLRLSQIWSDFAIMNPTVMEFTEACALIKEHVSNCPDEIWPLALTMPVNRIVKKLNSFYPFNGAAKGAYVFPRLAGIRIFLLYRQAANETPHLYAAYYKDEDNLILGIDTLIKLGAPRYLGENGNKIIIDSYTPFGRHPLYVVVGTIAVPKELIDKAKSIGKNTREIFHHFLMDTTPRKTKDAFDNSFYVNQLKETKERLDKLSRKLETVNGHSRVKLKIKVSEMQRLYATQSALVSGSNPELDYANYRSTLPEHFLKLVAHELYLWENAELKAAPIPPTQLPTHLSSLGFCSFRFSTLETIAYSLNDEILNPKKVAETFERILGFRVTGLIIQPKAKTARLRFVSIKE